MGQGEALRYRARAGEGGYLERLPGELKGPLLDGWGLTSGDEVFYATDSGADVFTLDPDTLELRNTARIVDDGVPLEMLNELEVVDGELWANLYGSDCLARISLDGSGLCWAGLCSQTSWTGARL